MNYQCYYRVIVMEELPNEVNISLSNIGVVLIPDIQTAKEGFWINKNFDYTTGSDAYFWVPPANIFGVTKLETEPTKEI